MFSRMRCIGTWPGPSFITWTSKSHAILVSSPCVFNSANCGSSLASAIEPGRKASLRHDRSAARDDAGHAARGHRDVAQQHAGVNREVVDALLALLDERVAVDLPREILGPTTDLLERLVDRHRPDRHGRIAQN